MKLETLQRLELNGGRVEEDGDVWRFLLPPGVAGYTDAQVHDYGRFPFRRRTFPWRPGTRLRLNARFSHPASDLIGTAGFGFWNAPFADPSLKWPALPQAAWFFFASEPNDLPLAPSGPGRGWFAATLDVTSPQALMWAPAAPAVLVLNQFAGIRARLWPRVQRVLGISFAQPDLDLQAWHTYELVWAKDGCQFMVNGQPLLETPFRPRGPLGFVCWMDNQYMVMTGNGRFRWGTLPIHTTQWLEVANLALTRIN